MSNYSNSDFLDRMDRRRESRARTWTTSYFNPNPLDHCTIKELKEKIINLTTPGLAMFGAKKAKQLRAEAGSHDLRRWIK